MIPHDVIKGAGCPVETGEPVPGPRNGIGDPPRSKPVELALIAVSESVAKLDEVAVESPIASARWMVHPQRIACGEPAVDTIDTEPAKIPLEARKVGVATIEEAALGGRRGEQRPELRLRVRQVDHLLCREPMKVTGEGLELRHHVQDVGVADGAPDLERSAWSVHFAHRRVGCGQGVDRFSAWAQPSPERD